MEEALWQALRGVNDPEYPVSLVDMGLIRGLQVEDDGRVRVDVTFTSMACPCMNLILDDIRRRLSSEPGVSAVDINITWDKAWTVGDLSESARVQFKEWGVAT